MCILRFRTQGTPRQQICEVKKMCPLKAGCLSQQVTTVTKIFFYSAVELDQGTTSHFLEGTFPEVTSSESQLKRHEEAEPAAHIKEARRPSSSNRPNHNMTWSIREEVERLMQDDFKYSSQAPKANTQQVRQTSNLSVLLRAKAHL